MKLLKLSILAVMMGTSSIAIAEELPTSSISYYESRISGLESQIRHLTGRLERESNENRRVSESVKKTLRDMEMRMGDLERKGVSSSSYGSQQSYNPGVSHSSGSNSNIDPNKSYTTSQQTVINSLGSLTNGSKIARLEGHPVINTNPNTAYERAFALIRSGKHSDAEQAFSRFLVSYPNHKLASNASYWMAETYYVRADYATSAKLFAKSYQKYPKGAKASDNLLKLGLSLAKLNKKRDACLTFKQLDKEFGGTSGNPVLRKAKEEENRLGCD